MGGALGNGVVQMIALAMTVSSVFSMTLWFLAPAVCDLGGVGVVVWTGTGAGDVGPTLSRLATS